ncbi:hypothetical protein EB796_013082 [Bugula neritina]|uniref:NADP-dependent 3-hydroxy acid dehydrogenase YdfG n=1 Tax=Bugula neritina TaxID=10212 RepID=A0A7J7JQI4_BUGNE|nr:hypothetical protein EB796_013082 [Bugula neritina]
MYYTSMVNQHEKEWDMSIDINCKGVVNGVNAVIQSMTQRKSGHIINMSSDAGRRGFAGLAVYSGTKFFVEGFSQALRHEMVEFNVKVTTVQPGDVKTELLSHTTDQEAKEKYDGSTLTTILNPGDIGKAIVFIASQPKAVAINEMLIEPTGAPI